MYFKTLYIQISWHLTKQFDQDNIIKLYKFFISDSESMLVIGFMQLKLAQIIRNMFWNSM